MTGTDRVPVSGGQYASRATEYPLLATCSGKISRPSTSTEYQYRVRSSTDRAPAPARVVLPPTLRSNIDDASGVSCPTRATRSDLRRVVHPTLRERGAGMQTFGIRSTL